MPIRQWRHDFPPLGEAIAEARRQRAGPPRHPSEAAYPHVLLLARSMLWREIRDTRRRDAVLKEFDSRVERIGRRLANRKTLGEQLQVLQRVLEDANFSGLDLRKSRKTKGPDDAVLLDDYESTYARLRPLFRRRPKRSLTELIRQLSILFPHLTPQQTAEAAHDKPSWAAYAVVGASHGLSPSRLRDRLTKARRRVGRATRNPP